MASVLTSDQVNYLIWRYLQECGYTYSIYAFQHETKAAALHDQYRPKIKPGSLISLIQRGLLYRELELKINKDGTKKGSTDDLIPFFPPLAKDLKPAASAGTGNGNVEADDDDEDDEDEQMSITAGIQQQAPSVTNSRKHGRGEEGINGVTSGGEKIGVPDKKKRRKTGATPAATTATDRPEGAEGDKARVENQTGQSPSIEELRPTTNGCSIGVQVETVTEIAASETVVLTNEEQKVNVIAWSPVESGKLVSGARSSMARIWSIPDGSDTPSNVILDHSPSLTEKQEVTAVQWSNDGKSLATATFDGCTKLWNAAGAQVASLMAKSQIIIKLQWNRESTILLSVYANGTLLAWDVGSAKALHTIEQANDVAWIDDENFAVATADGEIIVYAPKTREAKARYKGEERVGILSLAWDESTQRLAAGDAKGRIAIWSRSKTTPEFSVQAHQSQVSQLSWQPIRSSQSTDSMVNGPQTNRILASRSDTDTVIRLWTFDSSTSKPPTPILELTSHASGVSFMSFSPDGKYLASGSYRKLYVWRVEDGFLSYVYDASAMKQEHAALTNGNRNGIIDTRTNGDVEMGGMDDNDVDMDVDAESGKGGPDSFDISDISWDIKGTVVAVAMDGLGCVLVPIKPKPQTPRNRFSPPPLTSTSENGSNAERNTSPVTAETAITSPSAVNGTNLEEQANGSLEKQNVR